YRSTEPQTVFAVYRHERWSLETHVVCQDVRLVPYSPRNNLLEHGVVLLPSEPAEYESDAALLAAIQVFIHRYVDVSPQYERVATRGFFQDRALESRCLTEELGQNRLRQDIPITMPAEWQAEALALRNQLLMFRFRNLFRRRAVETLVNRNIEPRLAQVFLPL